MNQENVMVTTRIVLSKKDFHCEYEDWRDAAKDLIAIETGKSKGVNDILDRFNTILDKEIWQFNICIDDLVTFMGCLFGYEVFSEITYSSRHEIEN